jgi:four helix bundle protein
MKNMTRGEGTIPNPVEFRFEKLEVWREARSLALQIYRITEKFPVEEKYGLVGQLRRASVSIASNIAEGSSRNSDKDFAHFLEMSYGSLMEVITQLILAHDIGYLDEPELDQMKNNGAKLAAKLVALNRSLSVSKRKAVGHNNS